MSQWIEEDYKEGLNFRLKETAHLFSGKSEFQTVDVAQSSHHGRVLLNDGCFMLCERDERIYHEMMAHVPLNVHPNPKKVLVIGGGDGGTAREVLRHPAVEVCRMVEIDSMVVEACRQFIPQTASAFAHPKMQLEIADGVQFMRESKETFDVILIDSTDPNGAAQPLFGSAFYDDACKRLAPDGILVAQGESVFYELEMQKTLMALAAERFTFASMFNFTNMTYPGGLWSFLWASKTLHPVNDLKANLLASDMFYYNQTIHRAAFSLPQFQSEALKQWTKI
jgi:spermidine synthase